MGLSKDSFAANHWYLREGGGEVLMSTGQKTGRESHAFVQCPQLLYIGSKDPLPLASTVGHFA